MSIWNCEECLAVFTGPKCKCGADGITTNRSEVPSGCLYVTTGETYIIWQCVVCLTHFDYDEKDGYFCPDCGPGTSGEVPPVGGLPEGCLHVSPGKPTSRRLTYSNNRCANCFGSDMLRMATTPVSERWVSGIGSASICFECGKLWKAVKNNSPEGALMVTVGVWTWPEKNRWK